MPRFCIDELVQMLDFMEQGLVNFQQFMVLFRRPDMLFQALDRLIVNFKYRMDILMLDSVFNRLLERLDFPGRIQEVQIADELGTIVSICWSGRPGMRFYQ